MACVYHIAVNTNVKICVKLYIITNVKNINNQQIQEKKQS